MASQTNALTARQQQSKAEELVTSQVEVVDGILEPEADPAGIRLVEAASKCQQKILSHLRSTSLIGVEAGRKLMASKALLKHGLYQKIVNQKFCIPNGVSIRTAERYVMLATNFDLLAAKLRESAEFANLSDEDLFRNISISEMIRLIRNLLGLQAIEDRSKIDWKPAPDPNDWVTPSAIIESSLALLHCIDIDPCCVPGTNPLSAIQTVCKPTDCLTDEITWSGRLFINPGIEGIAHTKFVERTLSGFQQHTIEEAIVLIPACTNSKYAKLLRGFPRAFINDFLVVGGPAIPKKQIRVPLMLVFIAGPERFKDFATAFDNPEKFDVYLPAK